MTPAIKSLAKHQILFEVLQFKQIETSVNFANDAAEQLCLKPEAVFKTIVMNVDGVLHIAILLSTNKIDLKAYAMACKGKRAVLADAQLAQSNTGYVIDGNSPFAQKKRLKTLLRHSAKDHSHIFVSAGHRGLEVKIFPQDIIRMCGAEFTTF